MKHKIQFEQVENFWITVAADIYNELEIVDYQDKTPEEIDYRLMKKNDPYSTRLALIFISENTANSILAELVCISLRVKLANPNEEIMIIKKQETLMAPPEGVFGDVYSKWFAESK